MNRYDANLLLIIEHTWKSWNDVVHFYSCVFTGRTFQFLLFLQSSNINLISDVLWFQRFDAEWFDEKIQRKFLVLTNFSVMQTSGRLKAIDRVKSTNDMLWFDEFFILAELTIENAFFSRNVAFWRIFWVCQLKRCSYRTVWVHLSLFNIAVICCNLSDKLLNRRQNNWETNVSIVSYSTWMPV